MKLYTFLALMITLPCALEAMVRSDDKKSGEELWREYLEQEAETGMFDARFQHIERRFIVPTIGTLFSGTLSYGLFSLNKTHNGENGFLSRAAWTSLIPAGLFAFGLISESVTSYSYCFFTAINPYEQINKWQRLKALKTSVIAAAPLIGFSYLAYKKYNHEIL